MPYDDDEPTPTGRHARVLVLGSANVDTFVHVDRFPDPGETIFGVVGAPGLGGKGANQAVAARYGGADVSFIGCVGDDPHGELVRTVLAEHGVDATGLRTVTGAPTGSAFITVDATGENTVIVASGANGLVSASAVTADADRAPAPDVGLTQGELGADVIDAFAAHCAARGIRFVLNLAPVSAIPQRAVRSADPLIVNETEALALLDRTDGSSSLGIADALSAVGELTARWAPSAIITLGAEGAVVATASRSWHVPAPVPARVVDTTGAGDAFVGAVAAALSRGASLDDATQAGTVAGSGAVQHHGTVSAYAAMAAAHADTAVS